MKTRAAGVYRGELSRGIMIAAMPTYNAPGKRPPGKEQWSPAVYRIFDRIKLYIAAIAVLAALILVGEWLSK